MKIPYTFLNFNEQASDSDYWDMALIKDILSEKVWSPAQGYELVPLQPNELYKHKARGGVLVIPARHNVEYLKDIQQYINLLEWCVAILCGDEESTFYWKRLEHPRMKLWVMQPVPSDEADFYLGSGYTPHVDELASIASAPEKSWDWFFAGQINHPRRQLCAEVLERMLTREDMTGKLLTTEGFTQGMSRKEYMAYLVTAKAIPAPSGIASPDSFRLYEALESGGVPIADDVSPNWPDGGYWHKIFRNEEIPFKVLTDYDNLEGYLGDVKRDYPSLNNRVFAWWQGYKKKMVDTLHEHIRAVSYIPYPQGSLLDKITVLIVTSPIKSHPSTAVIEQSITDLRKVLPNVEIIIGIDGVRAEQEHYRERYEEYKRRLLWKCNWQWHNVLPVIFDSHMHQSGMVRQLLPKVRTEAILFVEHDTSLCPDFEYPWAAMLKMIEAGTAYTIRFHHEAHIPEEHKHLMIEPLIEQDGVTMIRTSQWSQRPHLSSTAFYRDMMERYFTSESRTMIEDKVHGYPDEAYKAEGMQGWYQWRIWIHHPEGQIKRSYTTDGRGDDPKFDMVF